MTLKHALNFKTRPKVTEETGGPYPRGSGKFQALRSQRSTRVRAQNAPTSSRPDCPSKTPATERQTAAGRRGSPGAPVPEARWRQRPQRSYRRGEGRSVSAEPRSPAGLPLRLPARANTHLGALGRRRPAPGSRPCAPTPPAASQRPKPGGLRTDARRASDSAAGAAPRARLSATAPLQSTSGGCGQRVRKRSPGAQATGPPPGLAGSLRK